MIKQTVFPSSTKAAQGSSTAVRRDWPRRREGVHAKEASGKPLELARAHSGTGPEILRFQDLWWKKLTSDLTCFSDT